MFSTLKRHKSQLVALLLQEQDRWGYWLPVFIALGIFFYFSLPTEPSLSVLVIIMSVLGVIVSTCMYFLRDAFVARFIATVCFAFLMGVCCAALRTSYIHTIQIDKPLSPIQIEGVIEAREDWADEGSKIILSDINFVTHSPNLSRLGKKLSLVRVTLRGADFSTLPKTGSRIQILASLIPPAEPTAPDQYNYRRQAFFERISTYAVAMGAPKVVQEEDKKANTAMITYYYHQFQLNLQQWRERFSERAIAVIGGAEGAIAAALLTGERGSIDARTNNDLRAAGTAHIISISGMHISMVGAFIFMLIRYTLALFPAIALRYSIKSIAAVGGLITVVAYTVLVGSPVPAQRSAFMTGLVFVAILLNRQALTMRSVALAASLILIIFPENIFHPSFQLSFAAITLLISAYEKHALQNYDTQQISHNTQTWVGKTYTYLKNLVWGVFLTSFIAGVATMPYAAWHFHRIQLTSIIGNFLALPFVGILVMPPLILTYPASFFGLDQFTLWIMGQGLKGVTHSAAWVAQLPGANISIPSFSKIIVIGLTFCGIWFALWKNIWLKMFALGLAFILLAMTPLTFKRPLALISSEGKVALRLPTDGLLYSLKNFRGMTARDWSLSFNQEQPLLAFPKNSPAVRCDVLGCVVSQPWTVSIVKNPVAFLEDCKNADIIIAPKDRMPDFCRTEKPFVIVDSELLKQRGSIAIYSDLSFKTSRASYAARPWDLGYRYPASE